MDGKVTLVDDDGIPLKKVDYPSDHDSEDEVESVDNNIAHSMALGKVCFCTKSLLEQWRDSIKNGDYDEDPYDDDMYEGQDIPDKIQDICDNLDIRVRGKDIKVKKSKNKPKPTRNEETSDQEERHQSRISPTQGKSPLCPYNGR
ncbi:hypothetical protein Tco_0378093 [Tanacetum coccineum]